MKPTLKMLAVAILGVSVAIPASYAQDHRDGQDHHDQDHYVRHDEWKKGGKIAPNDWQRAQPVDYHARHLSAPPRGYEWRSVDGNYVLAAAATGIIASAIIASTIH